MTRDQLEHIIRASSMIVNDDEIVIIGSQSVLGQFAEAPFELLVSNEADVYPKNRPELADLIDGSIGEGSMFHDTFGYYAQGVGEETATLPFGWRERLIPVNGPGTRGATGWCLEIHDLLISKLIAGREKDFEFAQAAIKYGLASVSHLSERLNQTNLSIELRPFIEARIRALAQR